MKRQNEEDVRRLIELYTERNGGVRAFAKFLKISPAYLSDMIHGRRRPGKAVLEFLRLRKVVETYYLPT